MGAGCERGGEIKKYKLVVAERSRRCKLQHRECVGDTVEAVYGTGRYLKYGGGGKTAL